MPVNHVITEVKHLELNQPPFGYINPISPVSLGADNGVPGLGISKYVFDTTIKIHISISQCQQYQVRNKSSAAN